MSQTNAKTFITIHLSLTLFWTLNLVGAVVLYFFFHKIWETVSILYLVLVSIYANMATHWGAYQASRAEKSQQDPGVKVRNKK